MLWTTNIVVCELKTLSLTKPYHVACIKPLSEWRHLMVADSQKKYWQIGEKHNDSVYIDITAVMWNCGLLGLWDA